MQHQRNGGFREMLEHAYNSPKEENEEVPQPPAGMSGFERQLEASRYGGSQHTVRTAIATHEEKVTNRNFGMGFGNMLEAAFPSGERRMLPKDNFYINAKPTTSEAFRWTKKKQDTSPHDLIALVKDRLHVAKQQRQKILILYYEELIRKLEHALGITKPVQRTAGFVGMLEAAFGGS